LRGILIIGKYLDFTHKNQPKNNGDKSWDLLEKFMELIDLSYYKYN
jgi:hypothetical protein